MSVYEPATETAVESNDKNTDPKITGPHWEDPDLVVNATTYWRCSECGYESIREKDLYRASFHAPDCAHSEGEYE